MSPPAPAAWPSITEVAELAHHGVQAAAPALVSVRHDPRDALVLGVWTGGRRAGHPADPLVGFSAPPSWWAVGLVASGQVRPLAGAPTGDARLCGPSCVTTLVDRSGSWASLVNAVDGPLDASDPFDACDPVGAIAGPDRVMTVLSGQPSGWVADALARCLGHATAPPQDPPGAWLEAAWLDRLAPGVLGRPSRPRSWRYLADRHPLAGEGPLVSPAELAGRTAAFAASRSWELLRMRHAADLVAGLDTEHPPGSATALDAAQWFDDGSFSRWVMRNLPPAEVLLVDLLAVLSPTLGQRLVDALTSVGDHRPW